MARVVSNTQLRDLISGNHSETVQRLTKLETRLSDLPERVTALEHAKYAIGGAAAVISTAVSVAIAYWKKNG